MDENCWESWKSYGAQRDRWTKVEGHRQTVKNVATDNRKVGKFGQVVESVATDGVKIEEKLCKLPWHAVRGVREQELK